MKRLFVAIKINPSNTFMEVYKSMVDAFHHDKISWANPDNMHITLKFLGDTDIEKIKSISDILDECSGLHEVFDIHIEEVGIFGSRYDPRVIWFGIRENDALLKLSEHILIKLESIGYMRDRQNFRPHLTLGRVKNIFDKKKFQKNINRFEGLKIQSSHIDSFALYESVLKQTGAKHFVIQKFPLIAK